MTLFAFLIDKCPSGIAGSFDSSIFNFLRELIGFSLVTLIYILINSEAHLN